MIKNFTRIRIKERHKEKILAVLSVIAIVFVVILFLGSAIEKKHSSNELKEKSRAIVSMTRDKNDYIEEIKKLIAKNKSLESKTTKLEENNTKLLENTSQLESELKSLEAENKELRSRANTYNSDLNLLSRILFAEAGGSTDEDMLLVGTVIFNRMAHRDFPNTLRGVIYQKGQYSPTWNGAMNKTPSTRAIANAKRLLAGERFAPKNVVFQAQFKQGSGLWKKVGTHYYCYG